MNIKLTATDRASFESYKILCNGLSKCIGGGYELVLHSLEGCGHSVIKVINGFHSGRTEGSGMNEDELDMLGHIINDGTPNYISFLSEGIKSAPVKCNAFAVTGEDGRIIGLLCINLHLNTPLIQVLNHFLPCLDRHSCFDSEILHETYSPAEDLISDLVNEVSVQVLSDPSITAISKNKEIIKRLHGHVVFKMKEAVQRCADILGIGKNTVYMHLRNIKVILPENMRLT